MADRRFRCFVIGETSLAIRCGEIVRERGHELLGLISEVDELTAWARGTGIPVIDPGGDLLGPLSAEPFDYLFSIVNYKVLPEPVLALPRHAAVNYHDALLPAYAGMHATSWCLIGQEREHGITWHRMTGEVDAGDVLCQERVEIGPRETAYSLNLKCYDAAIRSFERLVDGLAADTIEATPQDLSRRSYFPRDLRPKAACVLDWHDAAAELDACCRALDFGAAYANPLGLPKLAIGGTYVGVTDLRPAGGEPGAAPGTILAIEAGALRVAARDGAVMLRGWTRLDGSPLDLAELTAEHGLEVGQRLPHLAPDVRQRLSELHRALARHEPYFARTLAAAKPPQVPYLARTELATPSADRVELDVPLSAAARQALGAAPADTRSAALIAAFGAYLERFSGESGFTIGYRDAATVTGPPGTEPLFAPHVPLPVGSAEDLSFAECRTAVEKRLRRLARRGGFLSDLVARDPRLKPGRRGVAAPAFPIVVERGGARAGDAFGARLALRIAADGLTLSLAFDPRAISPEDAGRIRRQFVTLLEAALADPSQSMSRHGILDAEERQRTLVEWNATRADYPQGRSLDELFEEQVAKDPDAVAVVCGAAAVSYRQLDRRANAVARQLREIGVASEALVGICIDRSIEMIAGMLGVLKAGGAYVPLDPEYPEERLSFILDDMAASIVLAGKPQISRFAAGSPARFVDLTEVAGHEAQPLSRDAERGDAASRLAYVIYTSGSTGRPKGVAIEHRSAATLVYWARGIFDERDLSGVLASTSICFDLSVFEIFVTLCSGGRVILAENALALPDLPAAAEVTLVNTVPSAARKLLEIGGFPAGLRTINLAGEPLGTTLVTELYKQTTARRVFDLYGPSEDTTYSTFALREPHAPATIGRPIANTQVYLLDRRQRPVPIGAVGELCLGGDGLARGYLHRPELTAERFISHPFSDEPGARIYRTGDHARYRPDGKIEFLGRLDHQVKVRGYRIELGEIETVLVRHPGVRDAVAVARETVADEKVLVAYVVRDRAAEPVATEELRRHLKTTLPEYMVPASFVFLDRLPLTPNGKIDRAALPEPDTSRPELAQELIAARDELETRLVDLWEQTLDRSPIGVRDDFFELGGHSLVAVRIFAQIRSEFGRDLRPDTLFQAPTVEALAEILRQESWQPPASPVVAIRTSGSRPPLFVVPPAASPGLVFAPLARHLGPDQPLFGLTPLDLGHKKAPDDWFRHVATRYVEEIRTRQAHGPYYVAGSCFGSFIAFEMAQQLVAAGEEVALLAVLDSAAPFSIGQSYKTSLGHRVRRLKFAAAHLVLNRFRSCPLEYVLLPRHTVRYLLDDESRPKADYVQQVWDANLRAASDYVAQPYPGRIMLILSEKSASFPRIEQRWSRLALGGLDLEIVPGKHLDSLKEPHVRVVAEKLAATMDKTLDRKPSEVRAAS